MRGAPAPAYERRMDMLCTCSSHCPLSGYHDAGCCEKTTCGCWCHLPAEPRASVMPANVVPIDPLFIHGVFNEFTPDESSIKEK